MGGESERIEDTPPEGWIGGEDDEKLTQSPTDLQGVRRAARQ